MRQYWTYVRIKIGREHIQKKEQLYFIGIQIACRFLISNIAHIQRIAPHIYDQILFFLSSNMLSSAIKHYVSHLRLLKILLSPAIEYYMPTVSSTIGYTYPPFRLLNNLSKILSLPLNQIECNPIITAMYSKVITIICPIIMT